MKSIKIEKFYSFILDCMTSKRKGDLHNISGFTILELMIAIVIMAILSSIVVSVSLSKISKARQMEAVVNINACKKTQQAYYAENSKFSREINELGLPKETNNFFYRVEIHESESSYPEQQGDVACCLAAEKSGNGQMLFDCVSPN